MKFKIALVAATGLATLIAFNPAALASEILDFGTTYTITGTGFTGTGSSTADFTDTVLLSPATQTFDGGTLQITETTTPFAGGEFAEFYISTVSSAPTGPPTPPPLVAGGSTSTVTFSIDLSGIELTALAITSPSDAGYFDFATNGVANTGITPLGVFGVATDPNPGSIGAGGNVFVCYFPVPGGCSPSAPALTTDYSQLQYPFFSTAAAMNINPNANGYFFGLELTATPLPSALPLFAGGLGVIFFVARRTKRKAAVAAPLGS